MSNYLAIATVTETLRQMLDGAASATIGGASATVLRPSATGPGAFASRTCINLFLYQVTPNAAWRNSDLPNRNGHGDVVRRPRAALDLHYLISFYGKETDLEAQRLLGHAVQRLHAHPTLTRQQIRDAVTSSASFLAGSDLAEEVELVRLVPLSLSLEELSKIWSVFFQSSYALSVAYQASVVLLEGDESPRQPLPVLSRNVKVRPYQRPVIEEASPSILEVGGTLNLRGRGLNSDVVKVRLGRTDLAPATATSELVTIKIPAGLAAGVNTAQVVQFVDFDSGLSSEPHRSFESNVAPFILAPRLLLPAVPEPVFGNVARGTVLTVQVTPAIGRNQDARLIIDQATIVLPARPPNGPPTSSSLGFPLPPNLPTGDFLVRLEVDGAQSVPTSTSAGFTGPRIVVTGGSHCLRATAIVTGVPAAGVTAAISIEDETSQPIPNVEVEIRWTLPDGSTQADLQVTDALGVAHFSLPGPAGNYRLDIEQIEPVTLGGATYYFDQAQSLSGLSFVK